MLPPALTKLLNAGWLIVERAIGVLIAFFVMTVVARHLGPSDFGAYAYLFSIAALLVPIAQIGLEALVMREIALRPDEEADILGSALVLQLAGAVFAYALAIVIVVAAGGPGAVSGPLMALAGIQILAVPFTGPNAWFKAKERMAWIVLPRIAVALAIAAGALLLVSRDMEVGAFVALRAVEAALLALAALVAFCVANRGFRAVLPSRKRIRAFLRDGWPLVLSAVAVALYMRVDQVMLGQLSGAEELGYYSIAVRVSEVGLVVPSALQASLFASVIRSNERGFDALSDYSGLVYDTMVVAGLATMVIMAVATVLLFRPVFGADYLPGLPMTLVLLLGLPWVGLGLARSAFLVARGWLWISPATTLLGAVVNIALNFALIPRFGGLGAASASIVAYWVAAHGSCFLIPRLAETGRIMTRSLNPIGAGQRIFRHFVRKEEAA